MIQVVKKLMIPICFIGVIMYMTTFLPWNVELHGLTYLIKVDMPYGAYYKLDTLNYLKDLENALTGNSIWTNIWPDWPSLPSNNPLVVPNMLIYVIRIYICISEIIFIVPFKIVLYPVNIILQLIGFNTNVGLMYFINKFLTLHIVQPSYF